MENSLKLIEEELKRIEEALQKDRISQHPFINKVSEYLLWAGGKRLRPLLCVLSAKSLNPQIDTKLYEVSLLFEYLHLATLLHDDVVDTAEFRRGRKTAQNLWGNQAVILVGDYLYAKSLHIASSLKNPEIMVSLTKTTLLMSEGEILQLLHLDDIHLTEETYYDIIFRKTAVLLGCSCQVGALLGGAEETSAQNLFHFGHYLGMGFQIMDDLLDYTSPETGKDSGKDFAEGKITLPLLLALKQANPQEKEELLSLIKSPKTSKEDFQRAYFLIKKNKGLELSLEKAKEFVSLAKEYLKSHPPSPYKSALLFLTDYLLTRKK